MMNKVIEKPWGKEELIHLDGKYCMKRLTMNKGHRCSLQFHRLKTETVYVVSGELKVMLGQDKDSLKELLLKENESLTIHPNQVHRMEAAETCVYLEASTPELDDVVRIQDDYKRSS